MDALLREPELIQLFLDSLLKKPLRTNPECDRHPAIKALAQEVEAKLVVLLSEMSANRVGDEFLKKFGENDGFVKVYDNIVRAMIEEATKGAEIEWLGESSQNRVDQESISHANNARALAFHVACQSLVTVRYYMKFLGDEYQRDISNMAVVKTIKMFYEN